MLLSPECSLCVLTVSQSFSGVRVISNGTKCHVSRVLVRNCLYREIFFRQNVLMTLNHSAPHVVLCSSDGNSRGKNLEAESRSTTESAAAIRRRESHHRLNKQLDFAEKLPCSCLSEQAEWLKCFSGSRWKKSSGITRENVLVLSQEATKF